MSLEFLKPKTHEFRMRNADGSWSDDWWTCSREFAEKLTDPERFEVREMEKKP